MPWVLGLCLWLVVPAAIAFQAGDPLSVDQANRWLEEARTQLEPLPADAAPDMPEARRRASLERRISLLEEYIQLFEAEVGFTRPQRDFDDRLKAARKALEKLTEESAEEPQAPSTTTEEGFNALGDTLCLERDKVAQIRKALSDAQQRIEAVPQLVGESRTRAGDAQKRGDRQSQ